MQRRIFETTDPHPTTKTAPASWAACARPDRTALVPSLGNPPYSGPPHIPRGNSASDCRHARGAVSTRQPNIREKVPTTFFLLSPPPHIHTGLGADLGEHEHRGESGERSSNMLLYKCFPALLRSPSFSFLHPSVGFLHPTSFTIHPVDSPPGSPVSSSPPSMSL